MIDICFPNNNEEDFIKTAEMLGTKALVFVYSDVNRFYSKKSSITVFNSLITTAKNVAKSRNKSDLVIIRSDGINDRFAFEQTKPDMIFSLEEMQRKDYLHQRASGLNHIHAKFANKNNIIVGFSFNLILNKEKTERARIMGRIMQNIQLCRKYKVKTCIASFATEPYELRNTRDIESLFIILGMHPKEAGLGTKNILEKIEINKKKKKGEFHEAIEAD